MEPTDLTLKVLIEIRDEARATNARLDVTNARLERTETHLTARLDNHERILLRVAEELGAIHGTLERIDGRVTHLEVGQELGNERLERLEAGQELGNERLERLEAGQQLGNERLERLEAGQQLGNERLERLEAGQQLGNERLRTLVGATGALAGRQGEGDAAIEELRRRIELLERKVG